MNKFGLGALSAALFACAGAAQAAVVSINNGDPNAAYYYGLQTYGEIKDNSGNNLQEGGLIQNGIAPIGPSNQNVPLSQSGSSLTSVTSASLSGFARAHTSASAQVSNASSTLGYTSIGSYGFRTQVQFNSAATPGRVVFNFNVSGSYSAPAGGALVRLDFLADGSSSGNFFDVFGGSAMHAAGAGNFQFTYIGSTATPLDIMFYAAAGALIGGNTGFPSATDGANFTTFADFSNTFDLTSIELYDQNDQLIPQWTLTDQSSNALVFDQNGRIEAAVPEPGTLAILSVGLGLLAAARRRRQS